MGQKRDFGRLGRMIFTTATPSLGNFIITRERDVGGAALILSEAFDIMAQRDLKGVHHQTGRARSTLFIGNGCQSLCWQ
jgi:hypothetical protein